MEILGNMNGDERQHLFETVAEAHASLSEVAFKLRRELTPVPARSAFACPLEQRFSVTARNK